MRTESNSGSKWRESMRAGFPELDEERKNVIALIDLLEVRPLYSIASEDFFNRFTLVQAAVERFIECEEILLQDFPVDDETIRLHLADHERIRAMLRRIREDSMRKKNQTAIDVYKSLRNVIDKHVRTFAMETHKPPPLADPAPGAF